MAGGAGETLLDGLRNAAPAERAFRQSQLNAAVRFCGKAFGQDYASLLTKATEVAIKTAEAATAAAALAAANSERKAART